MFCSVQKLKQFQCKVTVPQSNRKTKMKTDSQLQQDVMAELKSEPAVHAEQIGVEVKDGVVTLVGHVDSSPAKWNAERAALRVAGVKALVVEIDVKLTGLSVRTDADIAHTVENVLLWTTYVPKDSIKIMVEHGWVTLSGEVQWAFQRATATAAVRYLAGVKGVNDEIVLKPGTVATGIRTDIEAALQRGATHNLQNISVSVNGSEVTLEGKVPTWADREAASNAAWRTSGVHSVIDHITIAY